jgi:hypothetical protein
MGSNVFWAIGQKGEPVGDILKFQLVYLWGVNYEPYRAKFENLIGRKVDSIELFPASEGFFAYQDSQKRKECYYSWIQGFFTNL